MAQPSSGWIREPKPQSAPAGCSPAAWLHDTRMKQARRLLADPRRRHQTIEGIAALVGCTSGAHFSRAFRRQFALFPRRWREQAAAANAAAAGAAAGDRPGPSAAGW